MTPQTPYVELSWNANTPSGITNNGVYYFQNVCSGKYLDIYNNETSNNTPLIQYSLGHTSNQRFRLVKDYASITGFTRRIPAPSGFCC